MKLLLLLLLLVGVVIREGTSFGEPGIDCPMAVKTKEGRCPPGFRRMITSFDGKNCPTGQGAVKTDDGQCVPILPLRRSADASFKDISDEPYCPKGKFYLNGDCVGRGRRAASNPDCPHKTDDGQCIERRRRAADASFKDISNEPYCPKGKFYLKGNCVGGGRGAADDTYCPPSTVKTDYGQCIVVGRRAHDVSKPEDGSDGSDEPYCPTGTFYLDGRCVPRL